MAKLLVIDDERAICWALVQIGKRLGHDVATASSAEQGLALAGQTPPPQAILLDVRLPGMDGLAALPRLRELVPRAPVIVMTAHGDLSTAVEAVRHGAMDYVAKPFDLAQIERLIERALAEPAASAAPVVDVQADGLIGRTAAMQEVFKRIALVAPAEACVLLTGNSGTGKELVARAIHRYSRRSGGPLVAVNVAALSPALAESELFGHVRGAFTGADLPRSGLLVDANGGTLFLDEVADIPLTVQVKLLRALEHGEVLPVGSGKAVATNFRLVTATHQDLAQRVRQGEFRHDLYYRLSTFQIELPPLAARAADIPLLADYFVRKFAPDSAHLPRLSPQALEALASRQWHGNVRELRNAIEHGLILARDGTILPEHLPPPLPPLIADSDQPVVASADTQALSEELRRRIDEWARLRLRSGQNEQSLYDELLGLVEPPLLAAALARYHGQCATAARALGMHRTTLRKKLDQYGIAGED